MLKALKFNLIFSTMVFLSLCSAGFALSGATNYAAYLNSAKTPLFIDLHTTQEVIEAYNAGVDAGATHMLIVWDTWDHLDSYNFVVFSYPDENVNDYIKYYTAPGYYRVSSVFAMHLDIKDQLADKKWHPEYPKENDFRHRLKR